MTRALTTAANRRCHCQPRHVLALGQDRPGKALDPIQWDTSYVGNILKGAAGPNPRLDVSGSECALHLDLQLSDSRPVTPQSCMQPFVHRYSKFLTALGGHDQGLAVRAESHQSRYAHRSGGSSCGDPSTKLPAYPARPR